MTTHTRQTAPIHAHRIHFANRRFGKADGDLKTTKQPTLIVDGNKELIIYTVNSFIL